MDGSSELVAHILYKTVFKYIWFVVEMFQIMGQKDLEREKNKQDDEKLLELSVSRNLEKIFLKDVSKQTSKRSKARC